MIRTHVLLMAMAALAVTGCRLPQSSGGGEAGDTMLASRVKAAFDNQPVYRFPEVSVSANRGVVRLAGSVPEPEQKAAALEIAEGVRGVAEVQNDITVSPAERTVVREILPDGSAREAAESQGGAERPKR